MVNLIDLLLEDHELIKEKLSHISRFDFLRNLDQSEEFLNWMKQFSSFKNFIILHHEKEDKVLYHWMILQNKNADKDLINSVVQEHQRINQLIDQIEYNFNQNGSLLEIRSDLFKFLDLYNEHVQKEERFIFLIAESLKCDATKEKELLKSMSALSSK